MAESSFPVAHKRMLAYEGGYSNHPKDPGGVTLEGVIQTVYNSYRESKGKPRRPLTTDMRGKSWWIAERDDIYRSRYWHPPKCGQLNPGVDAAIYDYSVNSGIGRGAKVLQALVGVPVDGRVGPETLAAANKRDPKALVNAICNERLAFLKRLRTWPTFGVGWGRRVADVRSYAGALAANAKPLPVPDLPVPQEGKGEVPDPKVAKGAVKGGVPAGGAAAGGGFWDWVQAHQVETAVIAAVLVVGMFLAIRAINNWRIRKQETPMPVDVVPELLGAPS